MKTLSKNSENREFSEERLKEKIETLKSERVKTYEMGAKLSARLLEVANGLNDSTDAEKKSELLEGVKKTIDTLFEQRELDIVINTPNSELDLQEGQKPSSLKKEARKARFANIQEGGKLDKAFTEAFDLYKKYA